VTPRAWLISITQFCCRAALPRRSADFQVCCIADFQSAAREKFPSIRVSNAAQVSKPALRRSISILGFSLIFAFAGSGLAKANSENNSAALSRGAATEIWVAPDGSDENSGAPEKPLQSISAAQRKARELRRLTNSSDLTAIRILLRGGNYPLSEPLFFRAEDSGTESSPTILEAAPGESPVLSGGLALTNWQKVSELIPGLPAVARGNMWTADAPRIGNRILYFRQLWVNNRKAIRARQPNDGQQNRLLVWDRTNHQAWIPKSALAGLREPGITEMYFQQQWEIAICRLKSLRVEGDRACVTFHSPEAKIQFEHPWPQPVMSSNGAPFFLANAIEFLDQPGEWFQEYPGGRIFYWPRANEDLTRAEVIAPALETLIQIEGTPDHPVAHLQFRGIHFAHTTWMRPSEKGHVPLQAGMFLLDAYKLSPKGVRDHSAGLDNQAWIGRPPGAISVKNANHLTFERCRFEHLASAGLDFQSGTRDDVVEGCIFRDIGGNGIQMGKFSDPRFEAHHPFNPSDEREIATRERIANNFITDCANEDWGCVGIAAGYVREIEIAHNEISDLPYTGISVGWGWNKAANAMRDNRLLANHIHHIAKQLCDTAGIYTLSPQPGSLIASNSVHSIQMSPYVSDPQHWFYLYLDEGSSHITVRDNWCPEERFLKNANGPGNVWKNNGPMVSEEIKNAAGLEPAFRDLLNE
jgi:hypothetical protein